MHVYFIVLQEKSKSLLIDVIDNPNPQNFDDFNMVGVVCRNGEN